MESIECELCGDAGPPARRVGDAFANLEQRSGGEYDVSGERGPFQPICYLISILRTSLV